MVGDAVPARDGLPGSFRPAAEAAIDVIRAVVGDVDLHPVAQRVPTGIPSNPLPEIGAAPRWPMTACRSRSGARTVETFREVEVELLDADEQLIGAVMARLRGAGVGEPDSTPKYVRALMALGTLSQAGLRAERECDRTSPPRRGKREA